MVLGVKWEGFELKREFSYPEYVITLDAFSALSYEQKTSLKFYIFGTEWELIPWEALQELLLLNI